MLSVLKRLPILTALLATLAAPVAPLAMPVAQAQAAPTIIQLPDGSVCQRQTTTPPPMFNGQPANYTCDGNGVILGNPTFQNGVWVVNHGVVTTGQLQSTDTIEMDITNVVLADGSNCEFTGKGAGAAVNGQRINYSCGTQGNVETVLIGDFNTSNPVWTATRARITGSPGSFVVNSQDTPNITRVVGEEPTDGTQPASTTAFQLPDGTQCTWQAPSQAQQFNGQPVTYTCGANNTVILGAPTFQNGTYTISTAVMTQVSGVFQFSSPNTLTVDITHVDLIDGIGCDFTGKGAGAAVNGQRINYTCGSGTNPQTVLTGDFNMSAPLWTATRVRITGDPSNFVVQNQDQPGITKAITANATGTPGTTTATAFQLPDGTQCTRQTPTAAQQLNGQPANYTCGANNQVILGVPTLQNAVWTINTAVMTQSGGSVQFQSPTSLSVDIVHVDLVDGVGCDFAGKGATAAVNGQRINYTCPASGGSDVALIGDFNTSAPLWTATRARFTGTPGSFTVQSQDTPGIVKAITQTAQATPGGAGGPVPQAPAMVQDSRYFNETKFRIDNDAYYNFFTSRGGTETFGFPVSRQFGFLGCQVQIFQRAIMQQCGDANAPVALLNLLDPEIFPYTKVNGSTFPAADDAIKNRTPQPSSPGYDQAIIQFVQQTAPDTFNGQPVNYYQTFNSTGGLEIWGAPISNPAPDPANGNFIYQRFQRGIMHYTVGQGTRGILLADYLKAIILGPAQASQKGASLPPDLDSAARGSAQYSQYCPGNTRWLCRPNDLPGTDLTFAFETG